MGKLEEEKQLNEELKINFENGFKKLSKKYFRYLLNHCKFTFGFGQLDSEELVSDVFFKAYSNFSNFKFRGENSIRNWLFTILKNHVLDTINKENRFKKENKKYYYDESEISDIYNNSMNNGVKIVFEKLQLELNVKEDPRKEEVWKILNEFTSDEIADIYCYFDCIPYEEISKQTSSTEVSTKKRITRLLKRLSNKLSEKFNLNGEKIYENIKKGHKKDISGRFAEK